MVFVRSKTGAVVIIGTLLLGGLICWATTQADAIPPCPPLSVAVCDYQQVFIESGRPGGQPHQAISEAIAEVARANNITIVLDKDSHKHILYAHHRIDITDKVIEELH